MGDYWENVDRWVRNTYLNLQRTNADDIRSLPAMHQQLQPGSEQPSDAADRVVGVWTISLANPRRAAGCCNGNCSRILYYLLNNILTSLGRQLSEPGQGEGRRPDRSGISGQGKSRCRQADCMGRRMEQVEFSKGLQGNVEREHVIDMDPSAPYYPISRQAKYRSDTAPMRKVNRFVSTEEFMM